MSTKIAHPGREQAVLHGRVVSATRSMNRYYISQKDFLIRVIRGCQAEIDNGTADASHHAEIRRCKAELAKLEQGYANSSLKRSLEAMRERTHPSGSPTYSGSVIENRSSQASGTITSAATGTSSRLIAKNISGYAAKFNKMSQDFGGWKEQIALGAFTEALKTSSVACLFNHDANHIYGRNTAMTLELREDSIGLWFVCHLLAFDPASYALARRIDRRDICGCSFAFIVKNDSWDFATRPDGTDVRTILAIDKLFDVGPVTYPAYLDTTVSATFKKVTRLLPQPETVPQADIDDERYAWDEYDDMILQKFQPISDEQMLQKRVSYRKISRIMNRQKAWQAETSN